MNEIIPIAKPYIDNELVDAVVATLKSGKWARGEKCEEFEREFASYIGVKHAFAVNSGTTALRLALRGLNLPQGAKVIVPDMSFIATAQAVVLEGFEPVFVDVKTDGNLDPQQLENNYSSEVKAVVVVHLHGQAAEMDKIAAFCKKKGLKLIEDASQAAGASFIESKRVGNKKARKIGAFGDVSAFSLYATKNLATGEGGIIAFNDFSLKESFSIYSNNGYYNGMIKEPLGDSLRMSDIHATIGLYYLHHLDELNNKRREIASYYNEMLQDIPFLHLPKLENNVFHHYNIVIEDHFPFSFEKARAFFYERGISIRQYYPYTLSSFFNAPSSPTALFLSKHAFSLPIYPSLREAEIKRIINAVLTFFKR